RSNDSDVLQARSRRLRADIGDGALFDLCCEDLPLRNDPGRELNRKCPAAGTDVSDATCGPKREYFCETSGLLRDASGGETLISEPARKCGYRNRRHRPQQDNRSPPHHLRDVWVCGSVPSLRRCDLLVSFLPWLAEIRVGVREAGHSPGPMTSQSNERNTLWPSVG